MRWDIRYVAHRAGSLAQNYAAGTFSRQERGNVQCRRESRRRARLDGTLSRRVLQIVIAARAVYDGSIYLVNMHAVPDDVGIEARLQMLDYTFFKFRRQDATCFRKETSSRSPDAKLGRPAWLRAFIFFHQQFRVARKKEAERERERG